MFNAQQFAACLAVRKEGTENRWSLLTDFVAEWHAPLQAGDGYSKEELDAAERRLGFALPLALREWYGLAGKWMEGFNVDPYELVVPAELSVEADDGEALWLFYEAQSSFSWGVRLQDLAQDDPPMFVEESGSEEGLRQANRTFSEFILQMIVQQTVCFTAFGGNAGGDENTASIVQRNFLPFSPLDWDWPGSPTRYFGSDDVLIELDKTNGSAPYLWVAARSEASLGEALKLLG